MSSITDELEPEVAELAKYVDGYQLLATYSIAISLKRIADMLEDIKDDGIPVAILDPEKEDNE